MRKPVFFAGLFSSFFILLCIIAVIPVAGIPTLQMNSTEQQATINALVNERFTATAIEQTASAAIVEHNTVSLSTPIPTLTLMPTATFEGSFSLLTNSLSNRTITIDVSQEAYEHYAEGWELYWREDYRDAEDEFDEAIELEPEWAEAYYSRVINHFAASDYDDALEDMEMAAELLGELDAGMLSWRIILYNRVENYEAAIQDGERIRAENPHDDVGLYYLALAYFLQEDYETAIEVIDFALLYDPTDVFLFQLRRDVHSELDLSDDRRFDRSMIDGIEASNDDDMDEAIEAFEEAVERAESTSRSDFDLALAYWNLALRYFFEDEVDDALDALEEAENLYPEMGSIYYLKAILQRTESSDSEYFETLNTGIERVPNFANTYISRGLYHEDNNDEELALPDQWRYLQLKQSHSLLWTSLDPIGEELRLPYFNGWEHRLLIEAEAGDRLSVNASNANIGNSGVDAVVVVLDSNNNPLVSNDDENIATYDSEISRFSLPVDGQYTIVIGVGTGGSTGILEIEIDLD